MQPEALLGMALGIVSPWEVTEVCFSKESNRLDIAINIKKLLRAILLWLFKERFKGIATNWMALTRILEHQLQPI